MTSRTGDNAPGCCCRAAVGDRSAELLWACALPKHPHSATFQAFIRRFAIGGYSSIQPDRTFGLTCGGGPPCGLPGLVATEERWPVDILGNCRNGFWLDHPIRAIASALDSCSPVRHSCNAARSRGGLRMSEETALFLGCPCSSYCSGSPDHDRAIGRRAAPYRFVGSRSTAPRPFSRPSDNTLLGDVELREFIRKPWRRHRAVFVFGHRHRPPADSVPELIRAWHPAPMCSYRLGTEIHYSARLVRDIGLEPPQSTTSGRPVFAAVLGANFPA